MLRSPHSSTRAKWLSLAREAGIFLLILLGVGGALYGVLSPFELHLQTIEAAHARSVLRAVGLDTRATENPVQFVVQGKTIEISPLCSGLVEFCLLIGAIAGTRTQSIRSRAIGIAAGVLALYVFNLLRISATVLQLVHTSLAFAEFTHDILFRAILILGFAGIYWAWINGNWVRWIPDFRNANP